MNPNFMMNILWGFGDDVNDEDSSWLYRSLSPDLQVIKTEEPPSDDPEYGDWDFDQIDYPEV